MLQEDKELVSVLHESLSEQPSPQKQAWNSLLAVGVKFLGKLGQAVQTQQCQEPSGAPLGNLIGRNERTGLPEFRIPLPDPQTAQKLGSLLSSLGDAMKSFGGKSGES